MIRQIQKKLKCSIGMKIEKSMRREPAPKKRKEDEDREFKIQNIITNRCTRSAIGFLRDVAHNLSLRIFVTFIIRILNPRKERIL
jgi:hypothetical protein